MSRIDDGLGTKIEFSAGASGGVSFWEKEVTPPGIDGGGANDTTTLRNILCRTKAPKQLLTLTDCTCKVSYDPALYEQILDMIQVNQLITITWPDNATLEFWGWADKFTPDAITEGTQPTATILIIPSNQNNSGVETVPVYTAG